ncbi:hypothetical protein PA10_00272 [Pseudomonas phage pPa_SNUABM_DT01]|nr:hypothetical protein PA10_00272 [Pseudomonas phage pPa_SNUABM_DT01]
MSQIALFDDGRKEPVEYAFGVPVQVLIPDSHGLTQAEVDDLMPSAALPIFTTYPKRNLRPGLADFYAKLKPAKIGYLRASGFVKGNEGWVLHGRIEYGDNVRSELLTDPRLVVLSVDIERGDPSKGRKAIGLDRMMVSPK